MIPSLEKVKKLPKYAQNYIAALKCEIERLSCRVAVLNGDQKPSNIRFEDYGDDSTTFVQSDEVIVKARDDSCSIRVSSRGDRIEMSWSGGIRSYDIEEAALIPTGHQQARLVAIQNMQVYGKAKREYKERLRQALKERAAE